MQRDRRRNLILAVLLVVWAIVTPFTWRDLDERPPEQVRGPKWLWRLASANLLGSLAYFLFGRREG